MPKFNIFLDSSALIAGDISETGAAHVLLQLGESEDILLTISEMVLVESERSIAKKSPRNLNDLRSLIKTAKLRIVNDPTKKEVEANLYLIEDPNDVPILLAAIKAKVDYLATHNRKHFIDDPKVAE
ncbi:MAG: PIN domain-containing protein, partial [Anaerolineae bacterium]|nr:PIN domain-containing protein [Anaerolineae bacterium]